jgi:hypothetical protein
MCWAKLASNLPTRRGIEDTLWTSFRHGSGLMSPETLDHVFSARRPTYKSLARLSPTVPESRKSQLAHSPELLPQLTDGRYYVATIFVASHLWPAICGPAGPTICGQPFVARHLWPDICGQPFAASHSWPDICDQPFVASHLWASGANHLWPAICGQPFAASHLRPAICGQPFVARHLWPAICGQTFVASGANDLRSASPIILGKRANNFVGHKCLAKNVWPRMAGHKCLATNVWPQMAGHKCLGSGPRSWSGRQFLDQAKFLAKLAQSQLAHTLCLLAR